MIKYKTTNNDLNLVFEDINESESLDLIKGHEGLKYAMCIAVAGRHSIMTYGKPGCGKTMLMQRLPQLLPHLMDKELKETEKMYDIAGYTRYQKFSGARPFRMPHFTATIEGMCGGGIRLFPGEISLAHNGVLFLDDAVEFRSSVLQMLRVPIENQRITLSRTGETVVYPAKFQLAMSVNPCPCGNFGNKDKVCLCSANALEQYWRKLNCLKDSVAIVFDAVNGEETDNNPLGDWGESTLENMHKQIIFAWNTQYQRQGKLNQDLEGESFKKNIIDKLTKDARKFIDFATEKYNLSLKERMNVLRVARTIADTTDKGCYNYDINEHNVIVALELHCKTPLDTLNV